MRSIFHGMSVSLLALAVAGCATPNPIPLDKPGDMPTAYTAPVTKDANAPIWPSANWWDNFQAPELGDLMTIAQKDNLSITNAALSVLIAEAADTTAFAPLLPTLSAGFSTSRSQGGSVKTGATSELAGKTTNDFDPTFSGSYVLDFFGANRDRLIQAHETLRASRYAEAVTGITVASSVASTYFQILSLRQRIADTRQDIELSQHLLVIIKDKLAAGVSSNLDLANEEATVAQTETQLPPLNEQEREARYALAILLGRPPENFDIKAQNLDGIISPVVQAGLPSDLLLRNPTIAEAEATLYAAHANVDAARAAFFPTFSLTGSTGWASNAILLSYLNPTTFTWSIGSSIAQTIFDGGRLKAASDSAKATQSVDINNYRNTVFTALQSAESAIGSVDADTTALDYTKQYEVAAAEAERISALQYTEGIVDITTLIAAQQSLFNAQSTLVTAQLAQLTANINLYVALGGGWDQKASDAAYKPQLDWWPL